MAKTKHKLNHKHSNEAGSLKTYLTFWDKHADLIVAFAIFAYALIMWWPTKNLPYHWDSAGFVINSAKHLFETNFQPLVNPSLAYAHPPLITATLALMWKLFGQSPLISHLVTFPFLPTLMMGVYFIGKKLSTPLFGLLSALIVGAIPVVLSEYGVIYVDLPAAAFSITAIAAWLHKRYFIGALIFSLAVITKIPSISLWPVFALALYLDKDARKSWQNYLYLVLPIAILGVWLGYHYSVKKWLFIRPDVMEMYQQRSLSIFTERMYYIFQLLFVRQNRWILLIGMLGSLGYLWQKKRLIPTITTPIIILLATVAFGGGFYLFSPELGSRYVMAPIVAFIILALFLLQKSFVNTTYFIGFYLLSIALFISAWHPHIKPTEVYEYAPPDNMAYQDIIKIGQQSARFLELSYSEAKIYGDWPENYQLLQPYQGYVSQALNFDSCKNFTLEMDKTQIVYVHPYSPAQQLCRRLMDLVAMKPLNRFESNGKWLELYMIDASATARLLQDQQEKNK